MALICMLAETVTAATFTVTTRNDTHDIFPGDGVCVDYYHPDSAFCSLRAAVEEANARPGPDTVFIPFDTLPIKLSLGTLHVTDDSTTIIGCNQTVIDAVNNPAFSSALYISSDYNSIKGVTVKRSRNHGLLIEGKNNTIGGVSGEERNIIIGSGIDNENACGLYITGPEAVENVVTGNFIGMYDNGTRTDGNRNGLGLADRANHNHIGGLLPEEINLVSGNKNYGIIITDGAYENFVYNNYIGPDITGGAGAGNGRGGIKITSAAHHNKVGADSYESGNLISFNNGNGIEISGYLTDYNLIQSNYIGTDITGIFALGNKSAGITVSAGARYNLIGGTYAVTGNLISGNAADGVLITGSGTVSNTVAGNIIGANYRVAGYVGNGTVFGAGVTISENASENTIGGKLEGDRNIISGNEYYGVYLTGSGTSYNKIIGNYIGVNATGTSSLYNGSGVVLRYGAKNNQVGGSRNGEGNVISGNRGDIFPFSAGVIIYDAGTDYNRVIGNLIGTSVDTTRALRNGIAGVIIGNGARSNVIGGTESGEANVIAGNGSGSYLPTVGRGVHIFGEGTRNNRITGNYIGSAPNNLLTIGNQGHGIGIGDGACDNNIGGQTSFDGNLIAANKGHGILITGPATYSNTLRYNHIHTNDSLGIALRNQAQNNIVAPMLTEIAANYISGHNAPAGGTVDIYLAAPDPSGYGEGKEWLISTEADSLGCFKVLLSAPLSLMDTLTAVATDPMGNTSEFSLNTVQNIFTGISEPESDLRPEVYSLSPNYPNPFNPLSLIEYHLPRTSRVQLMIYNSLGQRVKILVNETQKDGTYLVKWNGTDDNGQKVSSGIYLYRIEADHFIQTRKMLLLK
ncbi:MAG: FlgD immunoglobulin-like domain containing protein [candidate division Zixibacteria bacterium]|nr:FlgD immunoglobulin-like domain containing protein [candidate division Zixibacteria bacterium]